MPVAFSRGTRWLIALGSVAGLGLVALAVLHTPSVRARMLVWLAARLEPAGIVLHADRLDYNLARLDVRLHNVTLATSRTSTAPFLRADDVHATFGWSTLAGRIDVALFEVVHPRLLLARTAD